MDPKRRASFINSVAAGQTVPCPKCGAANNPGEKHCISCGADFAASSAPAFARVAETPAATKSVKYTEPSAVFADGLPAWDIVPPQVMVRRR